MSLSLVSLCGWRGQSGGLWLASVIAWHGRLHGAVEVSSWSFSTRASSARAYLRCAGCKNGGPQSCRNSVNNNAEGSMCWPWFKVKTPFRRHLCLLRDASSTSSQVSHILYRSFLTMPLQFVLGRPGPVLKPGTSQYSACCGMRWWSMIRIRWPS